MNKPPGDTPVAEDTSLAPHALSTHPHALDSLGAFFSDNAWLSLFTLLLLFGLTGGLFRYVASMHPVGFVVASGDASTLTRGVQMAGPTHRCGPVLAIFKRDITVRQVSDVLQTLDAVIIYGPDENGAFELQVSARRAREVAEALEKSSLVSAASARPECF